MKIKKRVAENNRMIGEPGLARKVKIIFFIVIINVTVSCIITGF